MKQPDMERPGLHNFINQFKSTVELFSNPTPTLFTIFSQEHALKSLHANIPLLDFSPLDSFSAKSADNLVSGNPQGFDSTQNPRQASQHQKVTPPQNVQQPERILESQRPTRIASLAPEGFKPERTFQVDHDTTPPVFSLKELQGNHHRKDQDPQGISKNEQGDALTKKMFKNFVPRRDKHPTSFETDHTQQGSLESITRNFQNPNKEFKKQEDQRSQETAGSASVDQDGLPSMSRIQELANTLLGSTTSQAQNSGVYLPQNSTGAPNNFSNDQKSQESFGLDLPPIRSDHQNQDSANYFSDGIGGNSVRWLDTALDQISMPHQNTHSPEFSSQISRSDISPLVLPPNISPVHQEQAWIPSAPESGHVSINAKTMASILNDELIEQARRQGVDLS